MAGRKNNQTKTVREQLLDGLDTLTTEELQARVLRAQLLRETMLLGETEAQVRKADEASASLETRNEQRQTELAAIRKKEESIQKRCRHKQGGQHQNILKGDGKPAVGAMRMLDGFTIRLSCGRCRKTVYTPNPALEHTDKNAFDEQTKEYEKMLEMFEDSGLDMIRGPEFMFMKKGVAFVPERV